MINQSSYNTKTVLLSLYQPIWTFLKSLVFSPPIYGIRTCYPRSVSRQYLWNATGMVQEKKSRQSYHNSCAITRSRICPGCGACAYLDGLVDLVFVQQLPVRAFDASHHLSAEFVDTDSQIPHPHLFVVGLTSQNMVFGPMIVPIEMHGLEAPLDHLPCQICYLLRREGYPHPP